MRAAGRAFGAGVLGAIAMTAVTTGARRLGVPVDYPAILIRALGAAPTPKRRTAGLMVQLVNGGLIAIGYSVVLSSLGVRAGFGSGAVLGTLHGLVAGPLLTLVAEPHPGRAGPGAFFRREGWPGVLSVLLGHVVYGMVTTTMYGHLMNHARRGPAPQRGNAMTETYNYDTFRRQMMTEHMHFPGGPGPGEIAPDFSLPTVRSGTFQLSAQRGRPVLIEFGSVT